MLRVIWAKILLHGLREILVLRKIETGMFRVEWLESFNKTKVVGITWIYCPGHAGVCGGNK
jgi:hypothetical protein